MQQEVKFTTNWLNGLLPVMKVQDSVITDAETSLAKRSDEV